MIFICCCVLLLLLTIPPPHHHPPPTPQFKTTRLFFMGRLTWRCTALPTTRCPTLCGWCTAPATWPCCVTGRTILRLVSLMWVTTQQTVHEFCLSSAWVYLYLQSKMEAGSSTWATHCQWVLFGHLPLWSESCLSGDSLIDVGHHPTTHCQWVLFGHLPLCMESCLN